MIKLSILAIFLLSFIYGAVFLFNPNLFIYLSDAEATNIAWLRNIGASIIGLLFFGCWSIYYKPHGKLSLLKIITITSVIQTLSLIFSRIYNEFSAQNMMVVDLTIFLAIFTCFYLTWLVVYKTHYFK